MYEDDNNMRVLGEEEILHIFPEDEEEEEVQVGDIVSAMWLLNGQWYEAKVLQKGCDVMRMMKRMCSFFIINASWCTSNLALSTCIEG